MSAFITLNIYGDDDEITKTYSQSTIPWGILKKSITISQQLSDGDTDPIEYIDMIEVIVCDAFRNRITQEELAQASIEDVISTFNQIVHAAGIVKKGSGTTKRLSVTKN